MADVRPFCGLRYDMGHVRSLSSVITPPYDVIIPKEQNAFHARDPLNIIRLEFGKEAPGDRAGNDKYTRAARTFHEWIQGGILVREKLPAFYLVEHRFPSSGGYKSYWGLIAAVRLEPFETGHIRPTEIIMKGPAADRMNLLRACSANFSPIMGIFDGIGGSLLSLFPDINPGKPALTASDDAGVIFNVWVITGENSARKTSEFFARRTLYIADGHHRYTTALAFRDERMAEGKSGSEAVNYLMMTLISSRDPGLTLLPTHRLVKGLNPGQLTQLEEGLRRLFDVKALASGNPTQLKTALSESGKKGPAFGLYGLQGKSYLLLSPRDLPALREMLPRDKPPAWTELDVTLLHGVIMEHVLGLKNPEDLKEHLEYSPSEGELVSRIDGGSAQLAFFLNPVPVSSVIAVADAGVRMPPKSTYFYPKTP
ncbi:MAG: DUF1015 domain-containing protein, partial [Chloroflexi bacterium]|nr:DUF1015 domain-containing protein [Chloroflexota bacterium]